jgi:hypothetical protein
MRAAPARVPKGPTLLGKQKNRRPHDPQFECAPMKQLGVALLFFSLLVGAAQAQVGGLMFPGPGPRVSSGGGYIGPGDLSISGIQAWVGIRAYSAAKAGTKAINLCDNTGANCSDESTNASGNLVVGTHGANNCATSDTCLVATLYDQSGGVVCSGGVACDVTQATPANMFTLKHNCRGGTQFCLVGTSSTSYVAVSLFGATIAQPFTISAVGRRTVFASAITNLIEDDFAAFQLGFSGTSGSAFTYAGTVTAVAGLTESNMYALNMLYNGASSNLNINGASNTVSPGANSTTKLCVGACFNGGSIEFYEGAVFTGDQSSHFTALYGNEHLYWGF